MSANLKIVSEIATADCKLDVIHGDARKVNGQPILMKDDGAPKLRYKDPLGKSIVRYAEIDAQTGKLIAGRTAIYLDDKGKQYQKTEITPFYEVDAGQDEDTIGTLIPASKNEKTEVFEIKTLEPLENYMDKYQMDAYYQVRPSPGMSKKDYAKQQAIESNTKELFKIWEHLHKKGAVARGTLNISSSGYLPSVGYLRAVDLGNKWTLEIAIFRENKPFTWSEFKTWKPSLKPPVPPVVATGKKQKPVTVGEI